MSELVQTIIQIFGTSARRVKRKAALTVTNMCGCVGGMWVWVCLVCVEGVGCGCVCIINLEKNDNVQLKIHKCSLGVKITHGTATASTIYIV